MIAAQNSEHTPVMLLEEVMATAESGGINYHVTADVPVRGQIANPRMGLGERGAVECVCRLKETCFVYWQNAIIAPRKLAQHCPGHN